jgi:phenylacetate-CoA ligase
MLTNNELDDFIDKLDPPALAEIQLKKFQRMLAPVLRSNAFYARRLNAAGVRVPADVQTADDYRALPFTTKAELAGDQVEHAPYGSNLTFPRAHYTRIHQTAGTRGAPLQILDTEESWQWWIKCWARIYAAAGVTAADRIFFAFSFGPFIAFWSAYDAARAIGALAIPGGGMSSHQRLNAMTTHEVTVLVCTPSYALHLAEVAEAEGIDIAGGSVRIAIQAGEPGASVPATRARIEQRWGAQVYDHAGAAEVGAWGFECRGYQGLYMNEGEFVFEVIDPASGAPAEEGELVISNLGRIGTPVIRYRTGDRVRLSRAPYQGGIKYRRLDGGVIGRVDDVMVVRGIHVYPSAIENVLRRFPEVGEFAVDVFRRHQLDEMEIRLEMPEDADAQNLVNAVTEELRNALGLRVVLIPVPFGTLPRFDRDTRRFTDHRNADMK